MEEEPGAKDEGGQEVDHNQDAESSAASMGTPEEHRRRRDGTGG